MKTCNDCGIELSNRNWFPSLMKKNSKLCKICNTKRVNEWKKNHPDSVKKYSKQYYEKHPKYNVPWGRENRIQIRKEMISAYGGKCCHCGITNPVILDIDHIKNDGGKSRKAGMWGWRLYRWLRKHGYPKDNFQLLCKNCNWIKEMKRRGK